MTNHRAQHGWLAIVLAAGRGTRMGVPKALMPVRGEPWWRVQARRLVRAGVPALWVVSPDVDAAMRREPVAPGRRVLADPSLPMFASVLAGWRVAAAQSPPLSHVFMLPVDVPAPREAGVYGALSGAGHVAIPTFDGVRGHPVCLPWAWVAGALADQVALAADPHTLRLDELMHGGRPPTWVRVDEACVTLNINTPSDLPALERTLEHAA